ncbi:MAG TPA: ABC transporter permease [Puia sp.]|jgi:putative ABC transport system permease protein|nr:ABC transporter permease [Puia sp.]
MLKNYITIALRNLRRNKLFSAINIFGLALGLATCLVILLFVQHELSYDRYNEKADQIVRVIIKGVMQGGELKEGNVMPPVAQTMKKDFPEVLDATRLRNMGRPRVSYGDKMFREDQIAFVDSNFFQVFTLPLLKGNAKTVLTQPNSVVITRAVAKKYFGDADPIGKVLEFKDAHASLTVTGMIEAVPEASHFHFGFFAALSVLPESRSDSWMDSNFYTYLVLRKGYDYRKLEAKLPQMMEKYAGPQMEKRMGITMDQFRAKGNAIGLYLQPLTDIHLHSDVTLDLEPAGDIRYVYIFSAIALFMLLIACINFMNLSTAGASRRSREVGIRKVLGSQRIELVRQFLAESLLLTIVAMVLALGIVWLTLPFFNHLTGQQLSLDLTRNPWALPGLLVFGLLTGLLAGSYPAFFLSGFNPIAVLKNRNSGSGKSAGLRSGLVVFQFFISTCLIVGTTVVYKQLSYIQHKKLGYDRDQVIVVQESFWLGKNVDVFRQQLRQDPRVASVSGSGFLPAGNTYNNNFFVSPNDQSDKLVKTIRYEVDQYYLGTLGMELAQGRNFSPAFGADSTGAILNETAVRAFGWDKEPGGAKAGAMQDVVGRTLSKMDNGVKQTWHVIGVVKDFHFRSLHEQITPVVMTLGGDNGTTIVKVKTADVAGVLASTKKLWTGLKAEAPFSWSFLDDRFADTYKAEQNVGTILIIFAGLTIFVACLGLFGLATFTAEQRTREIGIRKVLGANVMGIVRLLSADFLKLVLVAFLLAAPVAWFAMNKWLEDFAYRVTISWGVFLIAAFLALTITIITISFRAISAATANPVKSLRSE